MQRKTNSCSCIIFCLRIGVSTVNCAKDRMTNVIRKLWSNYKYRFVPWLSLQIKESKNVEETGQNKASQDLIRVHHVSKGEDRRLGEEELQVILGDLFQEFLPAIHKNRSDVDLDRIHEHNKDVMRRKLGFSLKRKESTLGPTVGSGVFIEGGTAKAGSLVGLYPGTIYYPSDPLLLASIRNQFIFRCKDGILIDGNDRGISKSIYRSCAMRDKFNVDVPCCDVSWTMNKAVNPLNVGQYVNNENQRNPHNVIYQECTLRIPDIFQSISPPLWQFLPNVWYNPNNNNSGVRLVPLVAVRDIEEGEELFSAYFTMVHD